MQNIFLLRHGHSKQLSFFFETGHCAISESEKKERKKKKSTVVLHYAEKR